MTDEIALYVHWPFCESKCPYCDFNSHVRETVDQARWRAALLAEVDHFAQETAGRRLTSIFFGGGTPSLMDPDTVAAIIGRAAQHWTPADDLEVTLEANPSSAEAGRFAAYRGAGVGRLSLGVQSLDDDALAFLGRRHAAAEARAAMALARETFPRISFDLIYARPGQTAAQWRTELGEVLDLATDHLSVYQLTIEPGTPFFRDAVPAADEDAGWEMFQATREILDAAGLPAYEISNHARPGAESRHNLVYWRGGDYAGVGPGAHGRLGGPGRFTATHQIHGPERWLAAVERDGHGTAKRRGLSDAERAEEMVMTGLRLTEGLDTAKLEARTGLTLEAVVDGGRLGGLLAGGFLVREADVLRATDGGRLRLNAVLANLLAPGSD